MTRYALRAVVLIDTRSCPVAVNTKVHQNEGVTAVHSQRKIKTIETGRDIGLRDFGRGNDELSAVNPEIYLSCLALKTSVEATIIIECKRPY